MLRGKFLTSSRTIHLDHWESELDSNPNPLWLWRCNVIPPANGRPEFRPLNISPHRCTEWLTYFFHSVFSAGSSSSYGHGCLPAERKNEYNYCRNLIHTETMNEETENKSGSCPVTRELNLYRVIKSDNKSTFESQGNTCILHPWTPCEGWKLGREVCTLASELSRVGLNPDTAINYLAGVLQSWRDIKVCAVPRIDVKLVVPSTSIRWSTLKIPSCIP